MPQFGRVNIEQNVGSPNRPGPNDDINSGFTVNSKWYQSSINLIWVCVDNTAGAAKWLPMGAEQALGYIKSANMNETTDQAFTMNTDLAGSSSMYYVISKILVTNASISLTTAVGGVYDAASKGGNAVVAASQAYSGLTAATKVLSLTIATIGSTTAETVAPILSLTTAQGAAATADFYLIGNIFYANPAT